MKRILTWLAALALCLMLPYGVQAQESPRPPLEDGAIGQLRVDLVFGSDAKAEPLPDVPLALLRVASLESDRGAAVYTTLSPFDDVTVNWDGMTAAQSEEAARQMKQTAQERSVPARQAKTDSTGQAVFTDLEPGMYLVYQTGKAATNSRYEEIEPFLVSVPSLTDGEWDYDIQVLPKTGITQKKPTSSTPPGTSARTNQTILEILFLASALAFLILHLAYRKKHS